VITAGVSQLCNWYASSANPASAVQSVCDTNGGTFTDHCPTASLFGCCVNTPATICYYFLDTNALSMMLVTACGTAGGIWSTTPP
jgi:hypothetical protein